MAKNFYITIVFLIYLSTVHTSLYAKSYIIQDTHNGDPLGSYMKLHIDDPKLSAEQVFAKFNEFKQSERDYPSWNITSNKTWGFIKFQNTELEQREVLIESDYAMTDEISLYEIKDGQVKYLLKLGDRLPFSLRSLYYRNAVFAVDLPPGESSYLISVYTQGPNKMPLKLWSRGEFEKKISQENFLLGIGFGFILLMACYNLLLAVSMRSASYFYYFLYNISFLLTQFGMMGVSGYFIENAIYQEWFSNWGFLLGGMLCNLFSTLLTVTLLDLKNKLPILAKIFLSSCIIHLVIIAGIVLQIDYYVMAVFTNTTTIICSISLLGTGLYYVIQRYRPAYFFTLARFLLLVGALGFVISNTGYLPTFFLTTYGLFIGGAFEVTLLSLALADRVRILRQQRRVERENFLKELIEKDSQLQKLSTNLKKEVVKQTEKLQMQRDKLIEQKKEIAQAHQKLKVVDQKKTRFFQNISHELRTPLTLILASHKNLVHQDPDNEELCVAERNARRLLRLVNQLLDFQKLTATEQKLNLKKVQLAPFLKHCVEYFQKACESKQIKLFCEGFESDDTRILSQIDALEKIVFNYLSNAFKYTPVGGTITIGLKRRDLHARIYVKDSGPGIDAEDQKLLFQLFSQVDDSDKRAVEGTGLGLALVKELASKMNGSVGIESSAGEGACFWVEFPVSDQSQSWQVLLVEPDENECEYIANAILQKTSIQRIKMFPNAEEALNFLNQNRTNIVLANANLPGMDGPGFLQAVANLQPQAHRILITVLEESHEQLQKAINFAKIENVFYKPFNDDTYSMIELMSHEKDCKQSKAFRELLIVDDDPQILNRMMLEIRNSTPIEQVMVSSNIKEAKRFLQKYRFKLVISDADLGEEESGADLLAHILQTAPETQRILLTAERNTSILGEAINRGKIQQILYKPIEFDTILPVILEALASSKIEDDIENDEDLDYHIKDWHLAGLDTGSDKHIEELDSAEPNNGTVIICDDVADMRHLMVQCLKKAGFQVLSAENGAVGLDKIRSIKPDLVITDWMMPKMTGPELITQMHKDEQLASIPTILLTAKSDEESKMIGTKLGATAYLSKPFDEFELQAMAKNLVELKKGERKIAELNRYLTEKVLCRFLPPKLVDQVIAGEVSIEQKPTTMPVTVLFSDLCHFTKMSEDMGPQKISIVLNQFLEEMSRVIFDFQGTIDKFIGDAIMAIFGAPESLPAEEQIKQACKCAIKMQEALQKLNQKWQVEGVGSMQMRIGIHHGPAVVGQFGSELRSEYTAIGPTVNYAARVQSQAPAGGIFISTNVRDYLKDGWQKAGLFNLKGIGDVNLFQLNWQPCLDDEEAA
ncbi:MAG: response regulator [Oligoflexus sp.]